MQITFSHFQPNSCRAYLESAWGSSNRQSEVLIMPAIEEQPHNVNSLGAGKRVYKALPLAEETSLLLAFYLTLGVHAIDAGQSQPLPQGSC